MLFENLNFKKYYVLRKLRNLYSAAFLSVYVFRKDALVGLNYRLFALLNDCLTLPFFDPLHGITHCLENGLDIFLLICIKL